MTREEAWMEFENELIRSAQTPRCLSYDLAEKVTEKVIKEVIAKWKPQLEQKANQEQEINKIRQGLGLRPLPKENRD